MRLPCERYLKFLLLSGMGSSVVLSTLVRLEYFKDAVAAPARIRDYVEDLAEEVGSVTGNARSIENYVTHCRLSRVWNDRDVLVYVKALVNAPDLRSSTELALAASYNTALVNSALAEIHGKVVPEEVIRLYGHLLWDLPSLSKWDLEMLFEIHANGRNLRLVYAMGSNSALLYSGGTADIDAQEELRFMRSMAAVKFREAALRRTDRDASKEAKRWTEVFIATNDKLGPMDAIAKLISVLKQVTSSNINLKTIQSRDITSITGVTHGIALLKDISESVSRTEIEKFNREGDGDD